MTERKREGREVKGSGWGGLEGREGKGRQGRRKGKCTSQDLNLDYGVGLDVDFVFDLYVGCDFRC